MIKKIILLLLVLSSGIAQATTYTQTWSNLTSVTNASGVLTKTTTAGWNNAGARARNTLMANVDGWLEFTIDQNATTANYMIGFSAINNVYIQTAIDFGIEVSSQSGVVNILAHEGSATGIDLGTVVIGDVIRVSREGSSIKYYKNGTVIRTVTGSATKYYITKVIINTGSTATLTTSYDVLNETGEIPDALEQAALKDMYDSLGGSAWTNAPYWPTTGTWPVNKISSYGVSLSNGDISVIFLSPCNVIGKIPASIGNLSKVTQLNLSGNKITGSIPSTMGNMTSLQYIYLGQNQITGTIPTSLGNFANLLTLSLGNNQLSGSIPTTLNNLKSLTYLSVVANKLTGDIPDLSNLTNLTSLFLSYNPTLNAGVIPTWIKNLTKLTGLYLINTNRTGSIPTELGKLTLLTGMDLSSNQLTGSIPTSFGKLTNLTSLQMMVNQLTGSIPDSLGYLTNLQTLSLYSNQLSGSIPSTFSNLTKLVNLYLYSNKLTGSIPSFFGNYTQMVNLYLYNNLLTGEIPSSLGNLTKIVNFQLQINQLTGSIPSSLGNLVNAQYFYLHSNQLTDSIPSSLGNLKKVTLFYVSANKLTGSIPSSLGNLESVTQLILGDNQLTGTVPSTLSKLKKLQSFELKNNQLSGDFPDIFGSLTGLLSIKIYNNKFTGAFPSSIGACTVLTNFECYTNLFTSFPQALVSLPVLNNVLIQDNELKTIPDFSTAVNKANLTLSIFSNRLDFSQMEMVFGKGIKALNYNAQKNIIDVDFISLVTGSTLTIPARNPGSYSTIYWEKLNGSTWTSVNSSDADATLKTYQKSAVTGDIGTYRWRMTNSVVSGTVMSGNIAVETGSVADAIEFAALKDLYDSLGGASWTNKTNWPTSWSTVATSTQMDTWNGVDISNGDISSLSLIQNNLTGKIPSSISKLKSLKVIDVHTNNITKVPSSVMTMTWLTGLNVSGNHLSGAIPDAIGNLTQLTDLRLNTNSYSGAIPSAIGKLVNLKNLMLQSNQLTGAIPTSLKNLVALDQAAFNNNNLSGSIPGLFGRMPGLDSLWLNNNQFTGSIPDSVQYATGLALLDVSSNQLTGSIPTSLGSLSLMKTFALGHNNITGTIPDQLQNFSNIRNLDLSHALLSGAIPAWLASKTALRRIALNDNSFTSFPDFSARTDKALLIINIQNNQIPITDIERYFTAANTTPFNTFTYSPQTTSIAAPATVQLKTTNTLTIEAPSGGTHGVYVWEKLNNSDWANVSSRNQSTTPNTFLLTNVKGSDAGTYRYTVTNTLVGGISYQSITDVDVLDPMDLFAYQYKYDSLNRMIAKKVPGAAWVYMVYDQRDRLVMIQDGEQRKLNKWVFTKYDILNRPIITGLYTHTAGIGQQAMSHLISTTNFFETYNGDVANHGYTNTVFPATNFPGSFDVLTVTYYDNYKFKTDILTNTQYNYKSDEYSDQYKYDASGTSFPRVIGQVTATKTKNLGDNTYLWSVNYYDHKYRTVQTIADNIRGGVDRATSVYDFTGKVLKTKTVHNISATTPQTVARTFDYDHAGRLNWVKHSLNGANDVVLVKNEYNELGQLITKKLHSTDTSAADTKQSVDYNYNIRGWLTSINDIAAPEPSDLFSMSLNYNAPTANGGTAQYNGNISEILWKGADAKTNSYGYSYDPMNRLTEAKYYNASDPLQNGRFNEKIWDETNNASGYDLNGNIMYLARSGKTGFNALGITTYGQMDNLTYKYRGNQLINVSDASVKTQGFVDGANTDNDYQFDANGNMARDKNKNITSEATANGSSVISYNHLNLPEKVVKNTGEYVKYYYDATGRKLRQEVYNATNTLKKQSDYVGEFFYENDTLKFINHEEGRVVMTGLQPEYQYHLKDHLGNVRVTFTSKEEQEENTATLETDSLNSEQTKFLNIDKARRINSAIFDHTYNNHTQPATGAFSVRLSGTTTDGQTKEKIGLIRSLSVMPGDKITVEVYAKYVDLSNSNVNSTVRSFVTSIAAGTAPAGTVIDGNHYSTSDASTFPYGGDLADQKAQDTNGGPKAYLNYLVFDRDFNFISSKSGYKKVTTDAQEDGSSITGLNPDGKAHQQLTASIDIAEAGYVYVYLSNEEETPVELYLDDFKVTQIKSPVIASNDYYPFGLQTSNSYTRENSTKQNFLFNGKEIQDELNLGWLDYGARMYMAEIGRWGTLDPLAEAGRRWSPFTYAYDNPIRFIDPDGMYSTEEWKRDHGIKDSDVTNVYTAENENQTEPSSKDTGKEKSTKSESDNTDKGKETTGGQQGDPGDHRILTQGGESPSPIKKPVYALGWLVCRATEEVYYFFKVISKDDVGIGPTAIEEGIEKTVEGTSKAIVSLVKNDSKLLKLARETFEGNATLRKEANALIEQLSKGNMNPGIGTKSIGPNIFEARSRGGARVYFRNNDSGIEILGYSSKQNQQAVIDRILDFFSK